MSTRHRVPVDSIVIVVVGILAMALRADAAQEPAGDQSYMVLVAPRDLSRIDADMMAADAALARLGWDESLSAATAADTEHAGATPGRVARVDRGCRGKTSGFSYWWPDSRGR